jgi:hypothetical protein
MNKPYTESKLQHALDELLKNETIFKSKDYYSLHNDQLLAIKRTKANKAATKQLKIAKKIAALLIHIPFIRGVAVSGSLSKNVAYEGSDIDFFIITKENRLWLSKLFFTSVVKCATFFGLGKWFCLNYVVDEKTLEVPEKNIFTATEIITLLPLYGSSLFDNFFAANEWVYDFFPNHPAKTNIAKETSFDFLKKIIEWLINNVQGDKADTALMRYFNKRWTKLKTQNKFTESGFQLGTMMADKHFCRPYPEHFQQKILDRYEEKVQLIKNTLRVAI